MHCWCNVQVRFAIENEFDEVNAVYISESEVRCGGAMHVGTHAG